MYRKRAYSFLFFLLFIVLVTGCKQGTDTNDEFGLDRLPVTRKPVSETMYWEGKSGTRHDTIEYINHNNLEEGMVVLFSLVRHGDWLLKDKGNNVYAKHIYYLDSLVAKEAYKEYDKKFDEFNQRDTISIIYFPHEPIHTRAN